MVVQGSRFREEWAMTSFTFTVLPTISHLTVRTLPSREVKLPDVFWSATVSKPSALPKLLKRKKERHNKSVQKTLLGYFRKPKVDYTRDFWLNQFFLNLFFMWTIVGNLSVTFFEFANFQKWHTEDEAKIRWTVFVDFAVGAAVSYTGRCGSWPGHLRYHTSSYFFHSHFFKIQKKNFKNFIFIYFTNSTVVFLL